MATAEDPKGNKTDLAALLRKSIKVHTEKVVRELTHLVRIAEKYKTLRSGHKNEGRDPSIFLLFDNGFFTTISGSGEVFNVFLKDKILGDYTGRNFMVRKPGDLDYRTARIRYLPFDRSFYYCDYDVDEHEAFDPLVDLHQKIAGVDGDHGILRPIKKLEELIERQIPAVKCTNTLPERKPFQFRDFSQTTTNDSDEEYNDDNQSLPSIPSVEEVKKKRPFKIRVKLAKNEDAIQVQGRTRQQTRELQLAAAQKNTSKRQLRSRKCKKI